jgi:hypothetical protein
LIVPGRTPGYARYQPTRDAMDEADRATYLARNPQYRVSA